MDIANRIVGAYLILVGAVVAIHTIAEPIYYTSTPTAPFSPAWTYINWSMALAIVLGVIFACIGKRATEGEGDAVTWERLAANTLFYGLVVVGIMFFWNWLSINMDGYTSSADISGLVWIAIDATLPVLLVSLGIRLARADAN